MLGRLSAMESDREDVGRSGTNIAAFSALSEGSEEDRRPPERERERLSFGVELWLVKRMSFAVEISLVKSSTAPNLLY